MKKKILMGLVFTLALGVIGFSGAWAGSYTVGTGWIAFDKVRKLARDSAGNLHCVYQRSDGSYQQIYYAKSTDGGENWTEETITSGNYYQVDPSIAIDSNDHIHVI